MNGHLHQRAVELFSQCERVILATCGPAGPQVCQVACQMWNEQLILLLERTSDQLFNLELQPELAVLAPECELHGTGEILQENAGLSLQPWQQVVKVCPTRLHVLAADGLQRIETIDF